MDAHQFRQSFFLITRDVQKALHDTMAPICQQCGLTLQQVHVLMELLREPGQTAGQLSDRAGILRTNFALVCRKLEGRGLVERRRSARDRRAFELSVTEEGRAALARVDEEIQRRYGAAFESEPPETFETVIAGLRALASLAEKMER